MEDWLKDAWDFLTDSSTFGGSENKALGGSSILDLLVAYGIQSSGINDMEVPKVGYQGKIPEYQVVRERVPTTDEGRRPGEAGRRYFSDLAYAQKPSGSAPTVPQAQMAAQQQAAQLAQQEAMRRAQATNQAVSQMAAGGLASIQPKGYYLGGATDGMADKVPASIDGMQEARLSDGEFVVPADVVSHLGNGNSNAGAKQLYDMMDRIRKARTGTKAQGKQVNPTSYTPA